MDKNKNNGYLFVIIAVLIWSSSGLVIKSVYASPIWIAFIRSLAGGIFLIPYMFKEKIFPIKKAVYAGIFMSLFLLSLTITTKISSSAMAISMQYTAPMYVIGYNFYKNKMLSVNKLIVFLLILTGIAFNVVNSLKGNIWAIFTGVITGISFVLYSYSVKNVEKGNPLGIVALINIISAIFYGIILFFNNANAPTKTNDVIMLVLAGVFISGLSYAFYGTGLRKVSIEKALIICLAEPILNPIWVYIGKGEVPSIFTIIGVLCILTGAVIDIISDFQKKLKIENI